MSFTVGELARLTGLTVRALHHYDEIGLVRPSQRTQAGYRLYDDADVLRLQQVLLFRELGLPLDEIASAIDDAASRELLLRQHREFLVTKRARIDAMVASLDAALLRLQKGTAMQPDDVKTLFDGFDPAQYEDEAEQRWGHTDAYRESKRRTQRYGKPEWTEIQRAWSEIYQELAALMRAGTPPADPAAQVLVERHRLHIDRWFYPCSIEMHKGLGAMYVADPRFTANLDKVAPGFARYLADAIAASG
jgi:MerR family transcriptional regulator, thiopeptide resistance regulator